MTGNAASRHEPEARERRRPPLAPDARRLAAIAIGLVFAAAVIAAFVRILPWALDPRIPRGALVPFAESLLVVAVEAAILVGWPVGWSLAIHRFVDKGEARVLASLGEGEVRTLARLAPQGAALACALAVASFALGRTSAAPGHVVGVLLAEGREACAAAAEPVSRPVPFVGSTWLCVPDRAPRLVGRAPLGGIAFSAGDVRVGDDLRRLELDDASLLAGRVHVRVGALVLRGLSPLGEASSLPPWLRALANVTAALAAAFAAGLAVLRRRFHAGRASAVAMGAAGPLAALATLRALERRLPDAITPWAGASFLGVPVAAVLATIAVGLLLAGLAALRPARARTLA